MARRLFLAALLMIACLGSGCPNNGGLPNGEESEVLEATPFASNTNDITGLAIRPSDGALFGVNTTGLYGPIQEGDDLSTMQPIGATNLLDADIFNGSDTSLALAITGHGEFWIGSTCCSRVAVVPPGGGDAAAFDGLLSAPSNPIKPSTLALVPDGFDGPVINPGDLLAGQGTTFSWLTSIDPAARTVADVPNTSTTNRDAEHLAFGPGPTLYSSRGTLSPLTPGLQQIDTDGVPTNLPGTLNLGARSFVVRANGDIVLLGRHDTASGEQLNGVLLYSAADQDVKLGVAYSAGETVDGGDMAITADRATIFLSIAARNEIVTIADK